MRPANAEKNSNVADPTGYPGTPRWVKVFGIIAVVVVLLFAHRLFVGGEHARHHIPASGGHR